MINNRLELSQIKVGAPIVDWKIEGISNDQVQSVHDLKGKPLLILFFSLGCPGCIGRAIPYANRMVYENGDQMHVVGIHSNFEGVDFPDEKFTTANKELYIRFPFYRDYNYDTTFLNYGAGGTPHWIVVDKSGIVRYSIFGSEPNNALLRLDYVISELLLTQNTLK